MVEPVPNTWPVHKLGYHYMVLSYGRHSIFVDDFKLNWCRAMFGDMSQDAWLDQGAWLCFKELDDASLYDMTWNSTP